MNRRADYDQLEHEYVTTSISLRALADKHGLASHSSVMAQSKKREWDRKRREFRETRLERAVIYTADEDAMRLSKEARVRDNAIDAIDEAITKMRADMQRTEKRLVNGVWTQMPVLTIRPSDLAMLIDRLNVLFGRPANITEERSLGVSVSGGVDSDILRGIVEATRGIVSSGSARSPIPRIGGDREN